MLPPLLTVTNSHSFLLNSLSFRYHHTPSHNSGLTSASIDLFPFTLISSLTCCKSYLPSTISCSSKVCKKLEVDSQTFGQLMNKFHSTAIKWILIIRTNIKISISNIYILFFLIFHALWEWGKQYLLQSRGVLFIFQPMMLLGSVKGVLKNLRSKTSEIL